MKVLTIEKPWLALSPYMASISAVWNPTPNSRTAEVNSQQLGPRSPDCHTNSGLNDPRGAFEIVSSRPRLGFDLMGLS